MGKIPHGGLALRRFGNVLSSQRAYSPLLLGFSALDDSLYGAGGSASAAIDALCRIDGASAVLLADRPDRAFSLAGAAIDARIGDLMGHRITSLEEGVMSVNSIPSAQAMWQGARSRQGRDARALSLDPSSRRVLDFDNWVFQNPSGLDAFPRTRVKAIVQQGA